MADAQTPEATPNSDGQTPVEPAAVVTSAEEFTALTDDQLEAELGAAVDAAVEAANPADVTQFDRELAEQTFARVALINNEIGARKDRADALAAAQSQAQSLAALRPAKRAVPSVADIPKPGVPAAPQAADRKPVSFRLVVPGDAAGLVEGRGQGSEYESFGEIGRALTERSALMGQAFKGRSNVQGLMQIRRDDTEFAISPHDDPESIDRVITHARNQKRLPGGNLLASWESALTKRAGGDARRISLTAAAGWCAPSETLYDLCEMESLDGLIDLPEVTATRGGFRYTQQPTFAQLMASGFFTSLTEAQVIADTPKACGEIPCPTFTEQRLNVAVTCLTGSFLQLSAYPELMARWGRGAMVAHAHKLNAQVIAALVTAAGAATVFTGPTDDAATSSVLAAVELAVLDTRYREGLSNDHVVEVVFPQWMIAQIRADYSRRNAGRVDVTDAEIMSWFTMRGARLQLVRDWQDFWGGVAAPSIGGPAPYIGALPTTVDFLTFPAGAVVLARQDVITLSNVYDSTNLQQNLYTQLFTEEGWAPFYPCAGLRLYTTPLCPSGATSSQVDWTCPPIVP